MTGILSGAVLALAAPVLLFGILELAYFPLALAFEHQRRRAPLRSARPPLVSVVVPAFDEERVIGNCVESILADRHPRKQILLVDDGSRDGTWAIMQRLARHPDIAAITRPNGGKAAALNSGLARARGEIICFVDADGIFTPGTITELLTGFDDPRVAAVCGNDEPVNLDRPQTHLLALLTHGTAFARRALARIGCLTIVSGNIGAFRRDVVEQLGGFLPGCVGEDLELTWRVHAAGHRVAFRPRAIVYAEVPSTPRALWRQRVRWTRGHVQALRRHRSLLFARRLGKVGVYLPVNAFAMLAVPALQLAALLLVGVLVTLGASPVDGGALGLLAWLGAGWAAATMAFAISLDRAWRDLRFAYVLPAWPLFSLMMSLVTVWALMLELRGRPARWNKLTRTGVVSRPELPGAQ